MCVCMLGMLGIGNSWHPKVKGRDSISLSMGERSTVGGVWYSNSLAYSNSSCSFSLPSANSSYISILTDNVMHRNGPVIFGWEIQENLGLWKGGGPVERGPGRRRGRKGKGKNKPWESNLPIWKKSCFPKDLVWGAYQRVLWDAIGSPRDTGSLDW